MTYTLNNDLYFNGKYIKTQIFYFFFIFLLQDNRLKASNRIQSHHTLCDGGVQDPAWRKQGDK